MNTGYGNSGDTNTGLWNSGNVNTGAGFATNSGAINSGFGNMGNGRVSGFYNTASGGAQLNFQHLGIWELGQRHVLQEWQRAYVGLWKPFNSALTTRRPTMPERYRVGLLQPPFVLNSGSMIIGPLGLCWIRVRRVQLQQLVMSGRFSLREIRLIQGRG